MKKWNQILTVLLAVAFLAVFTTNLIAQDKKDIKKEVTKVLKTDTKHDCAKAYSETKAKPECKDPAKCDHEKHDGQKSDCSGECQKKHAAGECKDHKPGECCKGDQVKKQSEKKDQK